jgi:hypothetical protein
MDSYIGPDGRWIHKFRQSWLNTFAKCPEQARALRAGEISSDRTTDSMILGTAVHAAIEHVLLGGDPDDHLDIIEHTLDVQTLNGGWLRTKFDHPQILGNAAKAFRLWCDGIAEHVDAIEVESTFSHTLHEDEHRTIVLSGTIDCLDKQGVVWDWKTAGRAYEPWEYQRWAIQPTVYTLAFGADLFRYGVMVYERTETQIVDVWRTQGHHDWLRAQCVTIAGLIESDVPHWPLNDQGWWCAEQWCPKFDQCKGGHVPVEWKQSASKVLSRETVATNSGQAAGGK